MKRVAILIGTSASQYGNLDGVEPDLNRYSEFLKSPYGGAWTTGEIIQLHNPSRLDLALAMAMNGNVDYSLITFSGHGGHDSDSGTMVVVSNDYEPNVSTLQTKARRQLLVIDACRSLTELAEKPALLERIEKVASFAPAYTQSCRDLYDKQISKAEEGRSILYSCSVNQSAGESSLGGHFTRNLVQCAIGWARVAGRPYTATDVLDVPTAFNSTAKFVNSKHYPQQPAMENGRRRVSFPLAVR